MAWAIDYVNVSQHVNAKINSKHSLDHVQVQEAIDTATDYRLSPNDEGVDRLLVCGETAPGRRILVVLYPTNVHGVWNLATAFPVRG